MKNMKTQLNICLLFLTAFSVMISSCKKDNVITAPASFGEFATLNTADTVGTYIIRSTNTPFKIPIGISNVADKDRTLQLSYSSPTAVQGQQYTAPSSIVIKAGQSVDSLEITGIYDGYSSITRVDQLTITISGGDVSALGLKSNYILNLKKYWEADLNAFSGTYIIQDYDAGVADGDPYEVELSPISVDGPTSYVAITGLWGVDDPSVKVTLNWKDLEGGKSTIPKANWFVDPDYGQATINPNGTGTFSTVTKTLTIGYEPTVSAGSFGKYTSTLTKK